MRIPRIWAFILLAAGAAAFAAEPAREERRLDPALKLLFRAQVIAAGSDKDAAPPPISRHDASEIVRRLGAAAAAPSSSLLLVVRFAGDERQLAEAGFDIQTHIGTVYTGTLAASRLGDLAKLPGIIFIEPSRPLRPFQERMAELPSTGAFLSKGATTATTNTSGAGALIAFVDSGADIRHQDFRLSDGTTRIKFLLDFSDPGDLDGDGKLDGPDDFGGTLYTEDEINRILRSPAPLQTRDTTGHGTHGLSVAAGDDSEFPGIAPGAALIVVKATRRDGTLDFEAADLLNALAFVDRKAAELRLPYVVNLSLGTSHGPHDGKTAEELAIDTLVGPGIPGKAVVLAAGNSNDQGSGRFLHFQGTAFTGLTTYHTLTIPPYSAPTAELGNDTALLDLWYEGDDRLIIRVTAPDGATTVEAKYGDFADTATPFGQVFIGNMGGRDPRNGDTEAVILLYDKSGPAPAAGDWRITLVGEAVTSTGLYHGWLVDGASVVGGVAPYLSANADDRFLIARPAGAEHGITVGSFARHDPSGRFRSTWTDVRGTVRVDPTARPGDISDFSSTGPTRDGRIKPEIAAPGEQVIGAVSQDAYPGRSPHSIFTEHPFPEPDALIVKNAPERAFGVMQGTSFSAPVVTGLVARLLAADPTLDAVQVKNILLNTSLTDGFTGAVPNESWGYGKAELGLAARPGDPIPSRFRIETAVLPTGVVGQQYNEVFSASGGIPPYAWKIVSGSPPEGIGLAKDELFSGTPSSAGTYEFTVQAQDSSVPPYIASRAFQIVITDWAHLEVVTTNLPSGDLKSSYVNALHARGGNPPYVWSLLQGELPTGIHLSSEGILAGAPLVQGPFFVTVSVKDAADDVAMRSLRLDVGDSSQAAWQPVALDDQFVRFLYVDPNNPDHLVAGVSFLPLKYSVFQSFDVGRTWSQISLHNGLDLWDEAFALGIDPLTSEIWALSGFGPLPYKYNSVKNEWLPWASCESSTGINSSRMIDLGFDTEGNIFLLPYYMNCPLLPAVNAFRGFLRSSDRGTTWQNIGLFPGSGKPELDANKEQLGKLSIFLSDSRHLYASRNPACYYCPSEKLQERFYRSNDGGTTWSELPINITRVSRPYISQSDPFDIIRGPWNPDMPWNPNYTGTSKIERSINGGESWTSYELPNHSLVCALERSISAPSVLLAGSTAGLFKSQDSGRTWQTLTIQDLVPNFCEGGALAIDPQDHNKLYVGLKNARIASSKDGGITWRVGGEGLLSRGTNGIALSASRPTDLLVISGIPFVSRTRGERWTLSSEGIAWAFNTPINSYPIISQADPDLFYFVDYSKTNIFRSTNRGISWTSLSPAFGKPTAQTSGRQYQPDIVSLVADPLDSNVLVARIHLFEQVNGSTKESRSMWRSKDRGTTWKQVREPAPRGYYTDDVDPSIAFAQDRPGHLFALGPKNLYESLDSGNSWKAITDIITSFPRYPLVVKVAPSDPHYIYVIVSRFVGVYNRYSSTWTWSTLPYYTKPASLAIDPHNPSICYLGRHYTKWSDSTGLHIAHNETGGIDKTTDGGKTWVRLTSFPKSLSVITLEVDPKAKGVLYAATLEDGVYRTQDGGLTWSQLNSFGVLADVVNVAIKDPNNPNLLFVGTQGFGVQVSTNGGQNYVSRVKGLTNLNVTSLAFDPGSPQILYAGTENGLFKSDNSGESWIPTDFAEGLVTDISVDTGTRPRRVRITTFGRGLGTSQDEGRTFTFRTAGFGSLELTSIHAESSGASQRLWMTSRGGDRVMISDDLGTTWKAPGGSGLATRNVNDLVIESGTNRVWIATDDGVFWTEDGGKTWSDLSAGLPHGVPVTSLSLNPDTGELLVSLFDEHNGGVYRGGNISGLWSSFNEGLLELRVRKLTNDGGHAVDGKSRATTFWAGTAGAGLFNISIKNAATEPQIITTSLSNGVVGELYSQPLKVKDGTAPYAWSLARGELPSGLGLEAATGLITGTPVRTGSYRFTVRVADSLSRSALREFEIQVRPSSTVLSFE